MTWNSNPWFGWELEGGAHFYTLETSRTDFNVNEYTALTGPRFAFRQVEQVAPFLHFLVGPAFFFTSDVLDTGSEFDSDVGFQPGGGIDIIASDGVAIRFGVDLRYFARDAARECRFTVGVTFR